MRRHDQQNTPFSANIKDLWDALRGAERRDGKGYMVFSASLKLRCALGEEVRRYPKASIFIGLGIALILGERVWSGSWF